jgi:hypothetical protein
MTLQRRNDESEMSLEERIESLEARDAIRDLSVRYSMSIDTRNIEELVELFVDDVDCGRWGSGRDALAAFFNNVLGSFYRTIHYPMGQIVTFIDRSHATGWAYSRAEHEDGGMWIIMAICYQDTYEKRNGEWLFVRRRENHWYSADAEERPQGPDFQRWPGNDTHKPRLPHLFPTWSEFWQHRDKDLLERLTAEP